ncbi:serine/threonine protein kinase [Planctomicrobium sp. SH527]|uniref:serine/threonine protein kinase n=1 Tax=Planctomicrobium sp. SH527 TaxID=3448123 RepID=UPI003F5B2241
MTNTSDSDTPSAAWIERMVEIDKAVRSGQQMTLSESGNALTEVHRFMSNLQRMHSASLKDAFLSHPAGCPDRIGQYQVRRILGAGGFAIVYQASDLHREREVAVKIPLPPSLVSEAERRRCTQGLRLTKHLDHQHIVPVYEAGEDGPISFIACEYCTGPTLSSWLTEHRQMAPVNAAKLVTQLADAVAYSHGQGILHQDLKPANVLLFPNSTAENESFPFIPKLSDFGLASVIESAAAATRSSMILGTPLYLAPEQIAPVSAASGTVTDVYGLGGILYELLTGQTPFDGKTVIEVLESIRTGKMTPVRKQNPQVPRDLAVICEKALSIFPTDRYSSAADLRDDLQRFVKGESIQGRPLGTVVQTIRSLLAAPRVSEAAGYVILSHAALLFWILTWPISLLLNFPMTRGTSMGELAPYIVPLAMLHLFSCVLGYLIGQRKYWAAITSTLLGGTLSLFVFSVLMRWISPPYPSLYVNVRTRDVVYLLLFSIFTMQSLLCLCACIAMRRQRIISTR